MKYVLKFFVACMIVIARPIIKGIYNAAYFFWNLSLPSRDELGGWSLKQQAFRDRFFYVEFEWKYSVKGYVYKTFWDFVMDRAVDIAHNYVTPEHIERGYTTNAELLREKLLQDLQRTCGNDRTGMEAFLKYHDKIMKMTDKELFLYDQVKNK